MAAKFRKYFNLDYCRLLDGKCWVALSRIVNMLKVDTRGVVFWWRLEPIWSCLAHSGGVPVYLESDPDWVRPWPNVLDFRTSFQAIDSDKRELYWFFASIDCHLVGAALGTLWRKLAGLCLLVLLYFVAAMQLAAGWEVVETWFLVAVLRWCFVLFFGDSSSNNRSVFPVVDGQRLRAGSARVMREIMC